jgi:hypothetical protein
VTEQSQDVTPQPHDVTEDAPPPGPWLDQPDAQQHWAAEGPHPGPSWTPPSGSPSGASRVQALMQRPEFVIGAAFVGGLVLATILKRLAR